MADTSFAVEQVIDKRRPLRLSRVLFLCHLLPLKRGQGTPQLRISVPGGRTGIPLL